MGQPESQRSAKGGWGRTGGREEWEEEQKSKYWRGSAGELPGTWAVPFPIQPFPLTPFPSHLSLTELPTWMCAHIPGCTHQRMVQPGTPRAWMVTNTIVPPAGVWLDRQSRCWQLGIPWLQQCTVLSMGCPNLKLEIARDEATAAAAQEGPATGTQLHTRHRGLPPTPSPPQGPPLLPK